MIQVSALLVSIATLLIAASGAAVILRQHAIAWRLFVTGCFTAASLPLIAAHYNPGILGSIATVAGFVAVFALCAAILGVRGWPIYLAVMASAVWLTILLLEPLVGPLRSFWWVVPLALLIPVIAWSLTWTALGSLRRTWNERYPRHAPARFFARWLNRFSNGARPVRRRQRHISDVGLNKRGKNGRGPYVL